MLFDVILHSNFGAVSEGMAFGAHVLHMGYSSENSLASALGVRSGAQTNVRWYPWGEVALLVTPTPVRRD